MEQTVEAPVEETPVPAPASAAPADPFALDETKLISLSPEQRAAVEPIIQEWKSKAQGEIDKNSKTYEEKYKPELEKAKALDSLVKEPQFVQWWQTMQRNAVAGQSAQA